MFYVTLSFILQVFVCKQQYFDIVLPALKFLSYPVPPVVSSTFGQPLQPPYNNMASPGPPPPAQQLTNQMSAMNLGNYGKFVYLFFLQIILRSVWNSQLQS